MQLPRNLPNAITASRLVMAVVLFALLALLDHARGGADTPFANAVRHEERLLLNGCLVIFLAAAISDILDGQIARRWKLQTDFGRIVDPFADKVVVCGAFILLVPIRGAQVASWMVVVILARELLVDGLRAFAEAKGVAFPAMASGKAKMVVQSTCISWIFFAMANAPAAPWATTTISVLLGLTLAITVWSGGQYVLHARKVLRADALTVNTAAPAEPAPSTPAPPSPAMGAR